ncbi:DsbA family protein [Primorskyibacter sp. S87]|uniref:DsbA family protein n=1 Tax=Primorskyibacter sp. S87 TaxID=3415126 RepID=UPI003C7EA403
MTRMRNLLYAVLAIALGGFLTVGLPGSPIPYAAAEEVKEADSTAIVEMVLGDENAPVEIIEYASFTCPHCASFHQGPFKQLKKDFIDTGKVKFVYREVYFDRFGLWASMIARCAGPEKFFGMTELIYNDQANWSGAGGPGEIANELRKIGRLAGLDDEQLEACLMDADNAQALVTWYQENAEEHGIQGTPSFIVNGEKVENQAYDKFKALIEAELGS